MNLRTRTFLITGGTGALGRAVTREFLDAGARVAVTWVSEPEWRALEREVSADYGEACAGFRADVTEAQGVRETIAAVRERFGALNGVVHLVGGFTYATLEETSPVAFERMLDMNLRSTYHVCHQAAPVLRAEGGGKILCVSARAALKGSAGLGAYSASKAGVITLVETLAEELRDANVQANCVLPSIIDTAANRAAMPDADHSRWVKPEKIARVLRFLASPDADIISGAAIPVYGLA